MEQNPNEIREQMMAETPDDIATLYSWANLHGAKYRDFSASRREHRIQVRNAMRDEAELHAMRIAREQPELSALEPGAYPHAPTVHTAANPNAVTYVREYRAPGGPPAAVPVLPLDNPEDHDQYSSGVEEQAPRYDAYRQPEPAAPRPAWLFTQSPPVTPAPPVHPGVQHSPMPFSQPAYVPAHPAPAPAYVPPPAYPAFQPAMQDTLQHQREQVASRWFALKGVFEQQQSETDPILAPRREGRAPVLAVFSLAGGVGKTSLVATLGRALSSFGERNLLVDTSSYGLLPFYFGSREWRPGSVRTFSPPGGTADAAINLVTYDGDTYARETSQDWLQDELTRAGYGMQRVLMDVATSSTALSRQALRMATTVVVPIVADLNSVVSLSAVDAFLRQHAGPDGRPVQPYFLLNQFDASLPLHLDVREVLRQQLGDRLLPAVIHRNPAVSEALAEGMTVVDYVPGSPVTDDYMKLAAWLRSVSAPAAGAAFRGSRWSER